MRHVWLRRHTSWLTLVAVLVASSAQAQTATAAEQEVRAAVEAHVAGYASNTVEGYFERYANDITIWWPSGQRLARETYRQDWTKTLADGNLVVSAVTDDVRVHMAPSAMPVSRRFSGRSAEPAATLTSFKHPSRYSSATESGRLYT